MALPPCLFFTLQEVTARWGCIIADVAGWAAAGRVRIMTGFDLVRCGDEVAPGQVVISRWIFCRSSAAAAPARPRAWYAAS